MRKKIIVAIVFALVLLLAVVSFGVSNTGLFHLKGIFTGTLEEDVDGKAGWEFVGNVSVEAGNISRLGT